MFCFEVWRGKGENRYWKQMFCVIEEGEVRRAIEVELWSGSSALGDATGIKRPEDRAKGNQSGKKKVKH